MMSAWLPGENLFARQPRPVERHALRQRLPRQVLHRLQRLPRADTRARRRPLISAERNRL